MKAHERVLLLAEIFGADVDKYIYGVLQSIETSDSYKELLKNVEKAKKYNVPYTEEFLKTYDDMKFSTIATIKDAFVARATIDHLSFVSSPRYFINPLLYNKMEMDSPLMYIEDLPTDANGKERTIEEVIVDTNLTSKEKLQIIDNVCAKWRQNAKEVVIDRISGRMSESKNAFKKNFHLTYSMWSDMAICILLNLFFLVTLFSQQWVFQAIRWSITPNVTTIAYLIFVGILFIYESWTLINYYLHAQQKNEKAYCFKYLRTHSKNAFKSLDEGIYRIQQSLIDDVKHQDNIKKSPLSKYNYLKNYRRIILFLESEDITRHRRKTETPFYYIKVVFLVLLLISFVFFLILTIMALGSGRII